MIALKLMDGIVSPVCQIESGFLIYKWKMSWMLIGVVSLETVLLGTQDGFESFSSIIHIV